MKLFGIPISGMMYYMNWVLTNAQIELISADCSVIDYNFDDKKKHTKGEFDDTPADSKAVRKAADEWIEKYGDGEDAGKGISIGDVLGGGMSEVGIKLT